MFTTEALNAAVTPGPESVPDPAAEVAAICDSHLYRDAVEIITKAAALAVQTKEPAPIMLTVGMFLHQALMIGYAIGQTALLESTTRPTDGPVN